MATTSQHFLSFRPTMGLLTTVAQLPHNYKIRYVTPESPLDLSVKPTTMVTLLGPITPPCTPSPNRKRQRTAEETEGPTTILVDECAKKLIKDEMKSPIPLPVKPVKKASSQKAAGKLVSSAAATAQKERKLQKAVRKLKFDEHKSSPVSGTIIRTLEDINDDEDVVHESGDIDPQYNIVEVTEEAKEEIAAIPNVIGSYACKLCRNEFEDAFGLARHRCSCIVLLEYRCPECGKRFNCPANLASHRRWHKPKDEVVKKKDENAENEPQHPCNECGKTFKRQAYLRKHMSTHKNASRMSSLSSAAAAAVVHLSSNNNNSVHSKEDFHACAEEEEDSCNSTNGYSVKSDNSIETRVSSSSHNISSTLTSFLSSSSSSTKENFRYKFTEEENLAAAALAHLRNGPTVIRHTTALAV